MKRIALFISMGLLLTLASTTSAQTDVTYPIVDTGLNHCFSVDSVINCGTDFSGQDAQYDGLQPSYQVNDDGTVTDLNTGLMWQQDPGPKVTYQQAVDGAATSTGARIIDSQWATSTIYEATVMGGNACFFGVNFADGRIKCYPTAARGSSGNYFVIYVRGNINYGINAFMDNADGTITDTARTLSSA